MLFKGFALVAALATLTSSGFCLCADESEGQGHHHGSSHSSPGDNGGHDHSSHRHGGSEPSHPHGDTEDSCVTGGSDLFSDCQPLTFDLPDSGPQPSTLDDSAAAGGPNAGSSLDEKLAGVLTRRGTPPLYLAIHKLSL